MKTAPSQIVLTRHVETRLGYHVGWSIYSETIADVRKAFDEAGIVERLITTEAGYWSALEPAPPNT